MGDFVVATQADLAALQREMYLMCQEGATAVYNSYAGSYSTGCLWKYKKAIIPESVTTATPTDFLAYSAVTEFVSESECVLGHRVLESSKVESVSINSSASVGELFCLNCYSLEIVEAPYLKSAGIGFLQSCSTLKTVKIPQMTRLSIQYNSSPLSSCPLLETIDLGSRSNVLTLDGTNNSLNLSSSTLLTYYSLMQLANALVTTTTAITITFAAAAWARLSAAEQAIYTNKGYTVTTV